jgi:hypothetical protein
MAFAVLTGAASMAGISITGLALGGVLLGHLVSGQLYVIGVLPDAFAALLDLTLAVLLVAVALRPNPRSPRSHIVTVAFAGLAFLSTLNPLLPSISFGVFGLRQLLLPVIAPTATCAWSSRCSRSGGWSTSASRCGSGSWGSPVRRPAGSRPRTRPT